MDELVKKLVSEVPQTAALVVLVWIFLKSNEKRDVFIRQLHDEHIEARRSQQIAITENTAATRELTNIFKTKRD